VAATVVKTLAPRFRDGTVGYRTAAALVTAAMPKPLEAPPHIDDFTNRLAVVVAAFIPHAGDSPLKTKLIQLVKFKQQISDIDRNNIIGTLRSLAKRCEAFANRLEIPK